MLNHLEAEDSSTFATEWPLQQDRFALPDCNESEEEGLGRLALMTPDVVASAATCIKTGRRTTLGWDATELEVANFNRQLIKP